MLKTKTKPSNQETIRNSKGRFVKGQSGNPKGINAGRKPVLDLYEALDKACKKHKKSFLRHFVERAYSNDQVAIALARKIIPDKLEGEGFAGDQQHILIVRDSKQSRVQVHTPPKPAKDKRF